MGYVRQYTGHVLYSVAAAVAMGVLFYLLRRVLYAGLSVSDYGLFYTVISGAMILQPVLSFGFDPGMTPFITRARESGKAGEVKRVLLAGVAPQVLAAAAACGLGWVLAGPIARHVLAVPDAVVLVRLAVAAIAAVTAFNAGKTYLLGMQLVGSRSLADFVRAGGCVLAAAFLLRLGFGRRAAGLAYVLGPSGGTLVAVAAAWAYSRHELRGRARFDPVLPREIFRSGKYLSVAYWGVTAFSNMDTVMLGMLSGDEHLGEAYRAAGVYQVAVPAVMIIYGLLLAAGVSFMPMVTTLIERGASGLLAEGIRLMYEGAVMIVLPAAALMACFSDIGMKVLFGRDVLNAPDAFNILAAGAVVYFVSYLNLQILGGMGRARAACWVVVAALAVNLVMNIALIPLLGIRGAALATVASHLTAAALGIRILKRELGLRIRVAPLAVAVGAAMASAGLALAVRQTAWYADRPLVTAAITCVVLYVLVQGGLEVAGIGHLRRLSGHLGGNRR